MLPSLLLCMEGDVVAKGRVKFTNRWMFNRVLCNEKVCRNLICALLGIEVGRIDYLNAEQCYEPGGGSRGVRMDVVAKGDGRIYDLEMQVGLGLHMGRRLRYYQSAMDTGELAEGRKFGLLPESRIVFICVEDPFGRGQPVYTLERTCREEPDLDTGVDAFWHVMNASAWQRAESGPVRELLQYVITGNISGALSEEIDGLVDGYNKDWKWVNRAMMLDEEIEYRCRMATEQGIEQGTALFGALAERLVRLGRADEISLAAHDKIARKRLLEEFGL